MLSRRALERRHAPASLVAIYLVAALAGCGGNEKTSTSTSTPAESGEPATGQQGGAKPGGGEASDSEDGDGSAGGEKSIETFGSEASGAERAAVVGAFKGYLKAVAAREPAAACSYLSAPVKRSLERFASRSLKRKGCPAILPRLLAPSAAAISRQQANGDITRVRSEVDRGFVVFKAPGAKLYQMPMAREGGEWKVGLVAAAVLVPQL